MTNLVSLLTDGERQQLTQPKHLNIGRYSTWNPVRECEFLVDLDSSPLATLVDEAARGSRVYEFMSIRRPGDVLHYLLIRLAQVHEEVVKTVAGRLGGRRFADAQGELPFVDFDRCFQWDYDDTTPHERAWLQHRQGAYWTGLMSQLFELVVALQVRLRQCDEYLLQKELGLIDARRHRRDFLAEVARSPRLEPGLRGEKPTPQPLLDAILELIRRDDVRSVSCPFTDYRLWRALVEEQVRRAEATGLPLQSAFCLCGPDSGIPGVEAADWGGEIHIPYEGACGADLFILPEWHRFFADKAREGGKLRWAVGTPCQHVLVHGDFGDLGCATRQTIGDWTLYTSMAAYEDCNPFIDRAFGGH